MKKKSNFVKKSMKFTLLFCLFCQLSYFAFGINNVSSSGRDFWLTFIPNYHNNKYTGDPALKYGDSLYIFISSFVPCTGKIDYCNKSGATFTQSFQITDPAKMYTFKVGYFDFELIGFNDSDNILPDNQNQNEKTAPQSFHITSDNDITVIAHNEAVTTSDAFLVLPTPSLGLRYLIMSYNSDGMMSGSTLLGSSTPSQFAIVATEDGTVVNIKPNAQTYKNGYLVQNVPLKKGEVYLVQALIDNTSLNRDMTGSELNSNKNIAVFSGHQRATVPLNIGGTSRDCLIEQMPPVDGWHSNALVAPYYQPSTIQTPGYDIVRVLSAFDSTKIYFNGSFKTQLNRGEFYESNITAPIAITASAPILTAEIKKTAGSSSMLNYESDPAMIIVPSEEQFLNYYKVINIQAYELRNNGSGSNSFEKVYDEQYISVVAADSILNTVKIDNVVIPSNLWQKFTGTKNSYAINSVSDGIHTVQADKEIGCSVYGYGMANSYGYIGGIGFNFESVLAPKITATSPLCEGDDIVLIADSIPNASYSWTGPNGFTASGRIVIIHNVKIINSGKYTVIASVNGRTSPGANVDVLVVNSTITPGDSSLALIGSAVKTGVEYKLTDAVLLDGGGIWSKNRYSVKKDFTTTFEFKYKNGSNSNSSETSIPGADGIAFVMKNQSTPSLGTKGGMLGYSGIKNSLAVEIDLFQNGYDPNGNHIAVQSMGANANTADHSIQGSNLGMNDSILTIYQDSSYFVKIYYNWTQKTLFVYIDNTGKFLKPALIINNLDLTTFINAEAGEYIYIGLTASTGYAYEAHYIFNWQVPCLSEFLDVAEDFHEIKTNEFINVYPNPANNKTHLNYKLTEGGLVNVSITNVLGMEITKLVNNSNQYKGDYNLDFDTSSLPNGIYFIYLQAGSANYVKKFSVTR